MILCMHRYFGLTNSANVLTAWIALDDADDSNGALRYKSGSHKRGVVGHAANGAERTIAAEHLEPDSTEFVAAVRRGGVVFHHGATQHSSGTNTSGRPRRAYGVHYVRRGSAFYSDAGVTNGFPLKALIAVPELSTLGDQIDPFVVPEVGRINLSQGVIGLRDECATTGKL
jgi:ectoine hydroxylase-related dioxygenase (phytanoyl-CoA dioxygenase family)|eukprot:COSAG02_NODE_6740_length_3392_cov_2.281506_1_plen_171_part_00